MHNVTTEPLFQTLTNLLMSRSLIPPFQYFYAIISLFSTKVLTPWKGAYITFYSISICFTHLCIIVGFLERFAVKKLSPTVFLQVVAKGGGGGPKFE